MMPDLEQQPSLYLPDPNRKIWVIPLTPEELLRLAEEVSPGYRSTPSMQEPLNPEEDATRPDSPPS